MKRFALILLILSISFSIAFAEEEKPKSVWDSIGGWFNQAVEDTSKWASQAVEETTSWVSNAATDAWNWTTGAANDAWNWTTGATNDAWNWTVRTASNTWNGVSGFFDPPATKGTPSIVVEPEFPEGTLKMYLGYPVVKTELDNGYQGKLEIGKDDPHFGLSIGNLWV